MQKMQDLLVFLKGFRSYSKSFFDGKQKIVKKYPKLISFIYDEIEDFDKGGKALRPYLVYLGYRIAGGKDLRKILPVCLAIELVHNFLLIHDDIIDRSDNRRGKLTVHRRFGKKYDNHYGLSQAIIAGDIVCFEAFKLITESKLEKPVKIFALKQLVNTLLETGYGEVLDIEYSYTKANLSKIWEVTKLKTAHYSFIAPLKIGATMGNVKQKQLKAIEQYGLSCGLSFQLQDDILGVFGNEKKIGKSILSDIREGKNTILFNKTRELARGNDRLKLDKIWGKDSSGRVELQEVQRIMIKTKAREWCEAEMSKISSKGKKSIDNITSDNNLKLILSDIADFVVKRNN